MKILLTGMTATHVGSTRRMMGFTSSTQMYAELLRKAGHTVEQRSVVPGEDLLKNYGRIVVGIAPPNALNVRHVYGALWALRLGLDSPRKVLTYFNDWNVRVCLSGFKTQSNSHERIWRAILLREHRALAQSGKHRKMIEETVDAYVKRWPLTTIFPLRDGGDLSLVLNGTQIDASVARRFDPTLAYPLEKIEFFRPKKRERRWVLGALSPQERWVKKLDLAQPAELYGCKSLKQARVSEAELIQRYAETRGVLAHPYYHAGSGWYRSRFAHAAVTGSIMLADPREAVVLGPSYALVAEEGNTIMAERSDKFLDNLANDQKHELFGRAWGKTKMVKVINEIIHNRS